MEFNEKLTKLLGIVKQSVIKSKQFFAGTQTAYKVTVFSDPITKNDVVKKLMDRLHDKESLLLKKSTTMSKVMYSKYMNEWKRKAFVKKTQEIAPDQKNVVIKEPVNATIHIHDAKGSITIVEPVNTTINIMESTPNSTKISIW